ncbi:MAG: DUF115 domain-containing protein [Treponema sp.]|jgi:hypothetical protein|nr:DUF115 domain-containing protein [Treponema sp.]
MPGTIRSGTDNTSPRAAALHSRYNPQGEAERYIDTLKPGGEIKYFILIEPGLAYLVPALKKKYPKAKIIALHIDRIFMSAAAGQPEIPAWFLGEEPGLQQFLEHEIPDMEARFIRIVEWRPSLRVYGEKYRWLLSETAEFIKRIDANKRTVRGFGKRWLGNFFKNLGLLHTLLKPEPFDGPLLITGSGPSLEIPHIGELKKTGNLFVLAASSSVKALVFGGVIPDLVISTDGGIWALRHLYECFRDQEGRPPPLAANLCAALPSQCSSLPLMVLNDGSLWQNLVFQGLGIPSLRVPQRGTVSASALDLALLLSSGPIFIAGMDLSVRDIKTHVRPYGFDPLFREKESRFTPFYAQSFYRAAEMNQGGAYRIYASWFQNQTAAWPDRIFSLGNNNSVFEKLRLFQNPVGADQRSDETTSWKSGQMPAFPYKSKVAVPKTEVFEQPQLKVREQGRMETLAGGGTSPERRYAGETIKAPPGTSAAGGAKILINALSASPLAKTLSGELSPLLFPEQTDVSAKELGEAIQTLARSYPGESYG